MKSRSMGALSGPSVLNYEEVIVAVPNNAIIGESPLWDASKQILFWVDIKGKTLNKFSAETKSHQVVPLCVEVGAIALRASGGLVAATRDGFAYLNENTGIFTSVADPEAHFPTNRFNDGSIDHAGNFVAGTMDDFEQRPTGSLYVLAPSGVVTQLASGFVICNGPAFSPDGKTLYFSNSYQGEIWAFPYDPWETRIGEPRTFVTIPKHEGVPDGLAVDSQGGLWCTHWGGGKVTRFTSDGKVSRVIELPAPHVTSCAFGGADNKTLFMTTACHGLTTTQLLQFPLSGSLFSVTTEFCGVPVPRFTG